MVWFFSLTRNLVRDAYGKIEEDCTEESVTKAILKETGWESSWGCFAFIFKWRVGSAVKLAFKAKKFERIHFEKINTFPEELQQEATKSSEIFKQVVREGLKNEDPFLLCQKWDKLPEAVLKQKKIVEREFQETKRSIEKEYGLVSEEIDILFSALYPEIVDLSVKSRKMRELFCSTETLLQETLGLSSDQTAELLEAEKDLIQNQNDPSTVKRSLVRHCFSPHLLSFYSEFKVGKELLRFVICLERLEKDPEFQKIKTEPRKWPRFLKSNHAFIYQFLFKDIRKTIPVFLALQKEGKSFNGCVEVLCSPFGCECYLMELGENREKLKRDFRLVDMRELKEKYPAIEKAFGENFESYIRQWIHDDRIQLKDLAQDKDSIRVKQVCIAYQRVSNQLSTSLVDQNSLRVAWCKQIHPDFYRGLKELQVEGAPGEWVPVNLTDEEIGEIFASAERASRAQGNAAERFEAAYHYLLQYREDLVRECTAYVRIFERTRGRDNSKLERMERYAEIEEVDKETFTPQDKEFIVFVQNCKAELQTMGMAGKCFRGALLTPDQKGFLDQFFNPNGSLRRSQMIEKAKGLYAALFRQHFQHPAKPTESLQKMMRAYANDPKGIYVDKGKKVPITNQFELDIGRSNDISVQEATYRETSEKLDQFDRLATIDGVRDDELFFLLQELSTQTPRNFCSMRIFTSSLMKDSLDPSFISSFPGHDFPIIYKRIDPSYIQVVYTLEVRRIDPEDLLKPQSFFANITVNLQKDQRGWMVSDPIWQALQINPRTFAPQVSGLEWNSGDPELDWLVSRARAGLKDRSRYVS